MTIIEVIKADKKKNLKKLSQKQYLLHKKSFLALNVFGP